MIGFIVEGFNDEASIKEIMPEAYVVVTKGTRFDRRVKMDIQKAIDTCEHVFILMDPDGPGIMMTNKIQEAFWGLSVIEIEEEQAQSYQHNFTRKKIGVEHCDPDYLKKVLDEAIMKEKYRNLEGYSLVRAKINDKVYEGKGGMALFEKDLYEAFEVTGNPKREKCYSLAWEHGHSAGYYEVLNYFSEFVELIK